MENQTTYFGVEIDNRTAEEKEKDYQAEEVVTFAPVNWQFKKEEDWRKFPIRNQDGSLSCVAQATAKVLGIENFIEEGIFIEFSAGDIYRPRTNAPSGGMWGPNAGEIVTKQGATTEERSPSQNMGESIINKQFIPTQEDLNIRKKYRAGGYAQLPLSIDAVASAIQNQKKGVLLYFYFNYDEWTDVPQLLHNYPQPGDAPCRHGVAGTDTTLQPLNLNRYNAQFILLENGEKAIVIDDSWGKFYGLDGQRIITESFFNKRCYFAMILLDLKNDSDIGLPKPKHSFSKALQFGMKADKDIKALQEILRYEGLFPAKVDLTGNYMEITRKGVLAWQKKHSVAPTAELDALNGKRVGPKTIAALNAVYGS